MITAAQDRMNKINTRYINTPNTPNTVPFKLLLPITQPRNSTYLPPLPPKSEEKTRTPQTKMYTLLFPLVAFLFALLANAAPADVLSERNARVDVPRPSISISGK